MPAEIVEILYDESLQPRFKRADVERFLGIRDKTRNFRDLDKESTTRQKIRAQGGAIPLQRTKHANPHDVFVTLDGAIAWRSRKPKIMALTKWLVGKGIQKLQDDVRKQRQLNNEQRQVIAILGEENVELHQHLYDICAASL